MCLHSIKSTTDPNKWFKPGSILLQCITMRIPIKSRQRENLLGKGFFQRQPKDYEGSRQVTVASKPGSSGGVVEITTFTGYRNDLQRRMLWPLRSPDLIQRGSEANMAPTMIWELLQNLQNSTGWNNHSDFGSKQSPTPTHQAVISHISEMSGNDGVFNISEIKRTNV